MKPEERKQRKVQGRVLKPLDNQADAEHAVIELLTDEELLARLNSISYPPLVEHNHLRALETSLLPAWREYLKQPHKDFSTFLKTARETNAKRN